MCLPFLMISIQSSLQRTLLLSLQSLLNNVKRYRLASRVSRFQMLFQDQWPEKE